MSEEQAKDFQADAALEGLDEELSVEELEGVAGGISSGKGVAWGRGKSLFLDTDGEI